MDFKAYATCSNGHSIEFGACKAKIRNYFGESVPCASTRYLQISQDEVQCVSCNNIYRTKACPVCNSDIPVKNFKKLHLKL